jgi:hypothetical protein
MLLITYGTVSTYISNSLQRYMLLKSNKTLEIKIFFIFLLFDGRNRIREASKITFHSFQQGTECKNIPTKTKYKESFSFLNTLAIRIQ